MIAEEHLDGLGLGAVVQERRRPVRVDVVDLIAVEAGVPVYPGFLDYKHKRLGIGHRFDLSGDQEADLAALQEFYSAIQGHHPEQTSPIRFV